jgi:hypothetical protein
MSEWIIQDLQETIKRINISTFSIAKTRRINLRTWKILSEIRAENFPNIQKDMGALMQKANRTLNRHDQKVFTTAYYSQNVKSIRQRKI